jgi:hypothetical protein
MSIIVPRLSISFAISTVQGGVSSSSLNATFFKAMTVLFVKIHNMTADLDKPI